jgi:3-deoxy-D-manno-octulosonic-acid transferase
MYELYSAFLALGLLVSLPYWLVQWLRHDKYRAGLRERLGRVPARLAEDDTHPTIWVHAVSVGEVLAVAGLVTELERAFPRHRVLVSTTTATGQKLARSRFGEDSVFYFPFDFAFAITPYLRRIRPQLVVIAETEFWPNFLRLSRASGARVAIVNARISNRSLPGYRRWRMILRRVLQPVDLFLAQTEEDRQRLVAIGASANRVQVSGNLKFDVAVPTPPPIVASLGAAFQDTMARSVIVCGSTVEGEEKLLLDAFMKVLERHPRAMMILAPRHPERFARVAQLLDGTSFSFWRRSTWNDEPLCGGVFLLDSIGELASLYALADLAFVGGSLVPRGGHNILEPARYGVPILVGPYTENFRDITKSFQANHALRVVEAANLAQVLLELASDEAERKSLGKRAAETVASYTGATRRTLRALAHLLEPFSSNMPHQP